MTPNSDSNRGVTADLVKTRRSSSNAVEVNPDDLSININKAYVESHKKKSKYAIKKNCFLHLQQYIW